MGYFTNIKYLEDFSPHLGYVVSDQGVTSAIYQWIILVLVTGGRDYVTPKRREGLHLVYKRKKTANWVIICYRSHLLPEPETSVDLLTEAFKMLSQ